MKHLLLVIICCTITLSSAPTFAKTSPKMSKILWGKEIQKNKVLIEEVGANIRKKNYRNALITVESNLSNKSPLKQALRNVILWKKFSEKDPVKHNVTFNDLSRFIIDNNFLPNIKNLKKNAELLVINDEVNHEFSSQYFTFHPSISADAKLYLLKSKIDYLTRVTEPKEHAKLTAEIQKNISDIWVNEDLPMETEQIFLQTYKKQLNESDHIKRIDRLLWHGNKKSARRMLDLVGKDYQKLFNARLRIGKNPRFITNIILSVPRFLRSNEGLYYQKVLYYRAKGNMKKVASLLADVPSDNSYPHKWWPLKQLFAREMLKSERYKISYELASKHGLNNESLAYTEAEWLAGWIALRFLDKPKTAYKHFNNLYLNVSYPISLSRASYWLGMASQAMGDKKRALEWYKIAANYPTYFYGQLAVYKARVLDKISIDNNINLIKEPRIAKSDIRSISKNFAAKMGYLLLMMKDNNSATKLFQYVIEHSNSKGEIAVIMKLVNENGNRADDNRIAKIATKKGVFFIKDQFQIIKEITKDSHAALIHSIIKQESGFNMGAVSSAGAIGFMQVMPATAKITAKKMGLKYSKYKLQKNVRYNVAIGSYYIKQLIEEFDGSEMVAIASYNAGPNNGRRWMKEFYDPRETDDIDKIVDWVELITYAETRNYVQRIMENLVVYKYLLSHNNSDKFTKSKNFKTNNLKKGKK